jgi:hypothetical protein
MIKDKDDALDWALHTQAPDDEDRKKSLGDILQELRYRNQHCTEKRNSLLCFRTDRTELKILTCGSEQKNRLKTISEVSNNYNENRDRMHILKSPTRDEIKRVIPVANQLKRLLEIMDFERNAGITNNLDATEASAYTTLYQNLNYNFNLLVDICKQPGLFQAFFGVK